MKNFIKVPIAGLSVFEFCHKLDAQNIQIGDKIHLKFRPKFRWKLKAFRVTTLPGKRCPCCGKFECIVLSKNNANFHFDWSLYGTHLISPNSLANSL